MGCTSSVGDQRAAPSIPVPNDPNPKGVFVAAQTWVAGSTLGFDLSNGVHLVVGD